MKKSSQKMPMRMPLRGALYPLEVIFFIFQDYFPTFLKLKKGRRDVR